MAAVSKILSENHQGRKDGAGIQVVGKYRIKQNRRPPGLVSFARAAKSKSPPRLVAQRRLSVASSNGHAILIVCGHSGGPCCRSATVQVWLVWFPHTVAQLTVIPNPQFLIRSLANDDPSRNANHGGPSQFFAHTVTVTVALDRYQIVS